MMFLQGNGYFIDAVDSDGTLVIGGRCSLPGAVSPNTGLALTQFARINLSSENYSIPGWSMSEIHFLYSWKCKIHEGKFSYRYKDDDLEVIEFCKGNDDYDGFPYDHYPILFDEVRLRLRLLTKEEQSMIALLNGPDCPPGLKHDDSLADRLSIPAHQFGGVPYLVDPVASEKDCVVCGKNMPVVASIGNKSYSENEGLSGNEFVQILYWACASCRVVSALNFTE
jgi:hypothetical protein